MSNVVTIRVPKNLKNEISKFKINWSEYLRGAMTMKLNELKRKKVAEHMDRIRAKTRGKNINMAKKVIEWRKKH